MKKYNMYDHFSKRAEAKLAIIGIRNKMAL